MSTPFRTIIGIFKLFGDSNRVYMISSKSDVPFRDDEDYLDHFCLAHCCEGRIGGSLEDQVLVGPVLTVIGQAEVEALLPR